MPRRGRTRLPANGFVFGGSAEAMRVAAGLAAVLAVAATMLLTLRLARGRITACAAGLLMATAGASPFIEGFTLSGELLASIPALLSLLAFTAYLGDRRLRWLVLAGLLTGCAVMGRPSTPASRPCCSCCSRSAGAG